MKPHLLSPLSSQANESQQLLGQKARRRQSTKFSLSEARPCDSWAGQERPAEVLPEAITAPPAISQRLGPQVSVWVPFTRQGEVLRTSPGRPVRGLLVPLLSVTTSNANTVVPKQLYDPPKCHVSATHL